MVICLKRITRTINSFGSFSGVPLGFPYYNTVYTIKIIEERIPGAATCGPGL